MERAIGQQKAVSPEWRLDKASDFLARSFAAGRVWHCGKEDFTGQSLHFFEGILRLAPPTRRK
jgi:hypothetical protein